MAETLVRYRDFMEDDGNRDAEKPLMRLDEFMNMSNTRLEEFRHPESVKKQKERGIWDQTRFFLGEGIVKGFFRGVKRFPSFSEQLWQQGIDNIRNEEFKKLTKAGAVLKFEVGRGGRIPDRPAPARTVEQQAQIDESTRIIQQLNRAEDVSLRLQKHWEEISEQGFTERDPEVWQGKFMENPSWTRAVAMGMESAPLLALAAAVGTVTRNAGLASGLTAQSAVRVGAVAGASTVGVIEATGERQIARNEGGLTADQANLVFAIDTLALSALESVPLFDWLKGGKGLILRSTKFGLQEGGEEVLQGLFRDSVAIIGYDDTRILGEHMIEELVAGAISGGVIGAFSPGRAAEINETIERARRAGVDVDGMHDGLMKMIIDNADKIRERFMEKMSDKSGELRFSKKEVEQNIPLKSNLLAVVESKLPNFMTKEQAKSTIKNSGLTQDEIEFTGLEEFLDSKDNFSKEEIVDFVEKNKVVVEETILNDDADTVLIDEDIRLVEDEILELEDELTRLFGEEDEAKILDIEQRLDDLRIKRQDLNDKRENITDNINTRYSDLVLPGGENYVELLETLPEKMTPKRAKIKELNKQIGDITEQEAEAREAGDIEKADELDARRNVLFQEIRNTQTESATEAPETQSGLNFFTSHWGGIANPIVHLRVNVRTDSQGRKILFVEEMQSDWHQKGKKVGYFKSLTPEKELLRTELVNERNILIEKKDFTDADSARVEEIDKELGPLQREFDPPRDRVPDAPFKKSWHELGIKKAIDYAIKNDLDGVAFINGQQTADRYDLSRFAESIRAEKLDDGDISLVVTLTNGTTNTIVKSTNELEGFVGKDLTEKILSQKEQSVVYSGLDLQVGGQWAFNLYDKIIPNAANKYVRKWGSKVEDIQFDLGKDVLAVVRQRAQKISADDKYKGFYITPQMKKEITALGQPLFGNRLSGSLIDLLRSQRGQAGRVQDEPLPDDFEGKPELFSNLEEEQAKQKKEEEVTADFQQRLEAGFSPREAGLAEVVDEFFNRHGFAKKWNNNFVRDRLPEFVDQFNEERGLAIDADEVVSVYDKLSEFHSAEEPVAEKKKIKKLPKEVSKLSFDDLEELIDQRLGVEASQEEMDLLETELAKRVSEEDMGGFNDPQSVHQGLEDDETGEGAEVSLEDALIRNYAQYLEAIGSETGKAGGLDVEQIISNMRDNLQGGTFGLFSEEADFTDEQVIEAAKDAYERKRDLIRRIKEKQAKQEPPEGVSQDDLAGASNAFVDKDATLTQEEIQDREDYLMFEKDFAESEQSLSQAVLELGGVKPHAHGKETEEYKEIPLHLRNKNGMALDDMVGELAGMGFTFEDGEELRAALIATKKEKKFKMTDELRQILRNKREYEIRKRDNAAFVLKIGRKLSRKQTIGQLKALIRKKTGQRRLTTPLNMDESKALKRSMKRQEQAARQASRVTRKETVEQIKLIRKLRDQPIEAITAPERKEIRELVKSMRRGMTLEDLRDLYARVMAVKARGKEKYIAIKENREAELNAIIDILVQTHKTETHDVPPPITRAEQLNQPGGAPRKGFRKSRAMTLRPFRWMDQLDGGQDFAGPHHQFFYDKANDATEQELARRDKRKSPIHAFMRKNGITIDKIYEIRTIDGIRFSLDEMMGVYAAWQHSDNLMAMMFGNNIPVDTIQKIVAIVETTPNLKNLADTIIQDFNDPEHFSALNDTFIEFTDGKHEITEVKGVYIPIRRTMLAGEPTGKEIANELLERQGIRKAYVGRGPTYDRKNVPAEYQTPINLNLFHVWNDHVDKTSHFITHGNLVRDMQKIVHDKKFRESIISNPRFGKEYYDVLERWVNRIANPNVYKSRQQLGKLGSLRANAAIAYLSYNMVTMGKQFPSISLFLAEVEVASLLSGVLEMSTNREATIEFIHERSSQMRNRSIERELEELKRANFGKYQRLIKQVGETGMMGIYFIDQFVTHSGWMAKYNESVRAGLSEQEAAREADKVVLRTQPAAHAKDIADLYDHEEVLNWFLQFSNQLNNIYGMVTWDIPQRVKRVDKLEGAERDKAARIALGAIVGVTLNTLMIWVMSHGRLPENEEETMDAFSENFIQMIPLIGPVINSARKGFGGASPAAFRGPEQIATGMAEIVQGDFDKVVPRFTEGGLVTFGVPYAQPKRTIKGALELISGETSDMRRLIWSDYHLQQKNKARRGGKKFVGSF